MKQFSLNEYLKNPNRKIITRDGKYARIICTNRNHHKYSVVALVQKDCAEIVQCYTTEGRYMGGIQSAEDLFFAPEKKEGWINLFKINSTITTGEVYNTKEEAKSAVVGSSIYISTVKVEWEE